MLIDYPIKLGGLALVWRKWEMLWILVHRKIFLSPNSYGPEAAVPAERVRDNYSVMNKYPFSVTFQTTLFRGGC